MAYRPPDTRQTARDLCVALRFREELGVRPITYLAHRRGHKSPVGEDDER